MKWGKFEIGLLELVIVVIGIVAIVQAIARGAGK